MYPSFESEIYINSKKKKIYLSDAGFEPAHKIPQLK